LTASRSCGVFFVSHTFSAVTVKHLVSIARIGDALVAHEAPATHLFADMPALVISADTQFETAAAELHSPLATSVKRRSPPVRNRPDIVIRIAREQIIGVLADFGVAIGEETVG
jgi:hypothetical protein